MDKSALPQWVAIPSLTCWSLSQKQINEKLAILEQLAGPHIAWYTHKNPFSCWICDYIILCRRLQEMLEDLYQTKSSLDFMNEVSSHTVEESRDVLDG